MTTIHRIHLAFLPVTVFIDHAEGPPLDTFWGEVTMAPRS